MKINELKEKRSNITVQIDELLKGELTEEVRTQVSNLEKEYENYGKDIEILQKQAERSAMNFKPAEDNKKDTFARAFGEFLSTGKASEEYRGKNANTFVVPASVMRGLTNTTAIGVASEKTVESGLSIAKSPALELLQKLGVKFVNRPAGTGDYVMSTAPMPTAGTVAEGVASPDASMSLTNNTLTPTGHRISVMTYFTVEEQAALNPQNQSDLIQSLTDAVWEQATYNFFDNLDTDAASAYFNTDGSTLSWDHFVDCQANVPYQISNPKYVAATKVASKAKKLAQIASVSGPIWSGSLLDGDVDGISASGTPFANANKLYYGDFSKAEMCQWGGLEIQFNPFEKDSEGEIKVVARAIIDSGVKNYRYFAITDASL